MAFMPASSRERADLLFAVFDALADPVFVKNSNHRWVYVNKAFERLIGRDDLIGEGDELFFPAEQVAIFHAHDRRVFGGEFTINEEQVGQAMFALTKKSPILLPDGSTGLVAILMDITSYKLAEAKVKAAEAESAAKSSFLADMSHEVRTPLNGVMGMAHALLDDDLTPDQREKVDVLIDSGRTLLAVVNDLLDLSKISAGKMEFAPSNIDVLEMLNRTIDLYRPAAREKHLELCLMLDEQMPARIVIDPVRAGQCLNNLVANAIKFTTQGSVTVSAAVRQIGDGLAQLEINVTDTGPGMSPDQVARLFQDYSQVDAVATRGDGGTGLGLAISRRLARLMGGDVMAESERLKGSNFRLTISCVPAPEESARNFRAAPSPASPPAGALGGRSVLLVDDNAINRRVAGLFLAPSGVRVVEAANGEEALHLLGQHVFDAVLMDMHMPVMDGVEAVSRIRNSGRPYASVPVIMLTANAMAGDRERFLGQGADGYVSKPIDARELVSELVRVISET